MLVITRKRGETIVIGEGIEVTVLRVGRDGVRLGVTAPRDVQVHRQEVYGQIRAANAAAASDANRASETIARLRAGMPLVTPPESGA